MDVGKVNVEESILVLSWWYYGDAYCIQVGMESFVHGDLLRGVRTGLVESSWRRSRHWWWSPILVALDPLADGRKVRISPFVS
jgi:hypothetical protein